MMLILFPKSASRDHTAKPSSFPSNPILLRLYPIPELESPPSTSETEKKLSILLLDKTFSFKPDGEIRFFNLDAALSAECVYITEGEIDAFLDQINTFISKANVQVDLRVSLAKAGNLLHQRAFNKTSGHGQA